MRSCGMLLLACSVLSWAGGAAGVTRIVDGNGLGDFTSIQSALDASSGPDTILVRPGTYLERLQIGSQHSGIFIKGDGPPEDVVIHGDTLAVGIWNTDPPVRLESLTITGGHLYGGIWVQGARAEIVRCIIRGNNGPGGCHGVGGGGRFILNSDVLVEDCIIEDNHDWESPGGLIVWSSRADIRGNIFRNNTSCYGGGLEMYHCESAGVSVIENNLFVGNTVDDWGGGLLNVDSSPVIRYNTFVENGDTSKAAIWVLGGSPHIDQNIIVDSPWAVYCQTHPDYPPSLPVIADNMCWMITGGTLSNCPSQGSLLVQNPLFCDAASGDYRLCADSPAAEGSQGAYGAFGVGCGACNPLPARSTSWGGLKTMFGEGGGSGAPPDSASGGK